MAEEIDTEVAVGHRILGRTVTVMGAEAPKTVWRYSCSCGEIHDVDTEAAQAHAEDVTP